MVEIIKIESSISDRVEKAIEAVFIATDLRIWHLGVSEDHMTFSFTDNYLLGIYDIGWMTQRELYQRLYQEARSQLSLL